MTETSTNPNVVVGGSVTERCASSITLNTARLGPKVTSVAVVKFAPVTTTLLTPGTFGPWFGDTERIVGGGGSDVTRTSSITQPSVLSSVPFARKRKRNCTVCPIHAAGMNTFFSTRWPDVSQPVLARMVQ